MVGQSGIAKLSGLMAIVSFALHVEWIWGNVVDILTYVSSQECVSGSNGIVPWVWPQAKARFCILAGGGNVIFKLES